ncbi:MAG: dihydroorotate dehydrogenase (NAD+) catalytic subunit [Pirellulaceae bacterium]|jgi:dihydroorotate dehydrogenase (NAD+) catalytic subunit
MSTLRRYEAQKTYQWNYDHPPRVQPFAARELNETWGFAGHEITSPLGVAAGPLLNGDWCLYYANLGFDVVTYKTVRSGKRPCYDLPNLQPVECEQLSGGEKNLSVSSEMNGSWAVSYGMPSQDPATWRQDIHRTRTLLDKKKKLSVSVVGTTQDGWTLEQLASDYALCARLAVDAGADAIEMNFSCPNVSTCDGQLFQDASAANRVATRVRESLGDAALFVKVGHMTSRDAVNRLVDALAPTVNGLVMTNSIAATVVGSDGRLMFNGQPRGICGAAIRNSSIRQVEQAVEYIGKNNLQLEVIGVGGICTVEHVKQYLAAGASTVQLATAVMLQPDVGLKIRERW